MANTKASPARPSALKHIFDYIIPKTLNFLVLVLALGLLAFISYDTFKGEDFLNNPLYMQYQFAVCMVFIAEYFYRFIISDHKLRFLFFAMPFLLISIPYLNIINYYSLEFDSQTLYCIRFIPLIRGLVALVMVVTYVAEKLTTTVFASYVIVLLPIVYTSALIFYMIEKQVNPAIKNFWYALWWAGMNVTTIGCYINPSTGTGMVLALILAFLGIVMFPLFTVYFGDAIQTFSSKYKKTKYKKIS